MDPYFEIKSELSKFGRVLIDSPEKFDKLKSAFNIDRISFPTYIFELVSSIRLGLMDSFYILKDDIEKAANKSEEKRRLYFEQDETARLNNLGIKCEKDGDVDGAIKWYEENIKMRRPATYSYDRLIKLYRKRKQYDDEKRIIEIYLLVFDKENKRRYESAIKEYPQLKDDIDIAMETNTKVKSYLPLFKREMYVFVPYDIMKYSVRLENVLKKISLLNKNK